MWKFLTNLNIELSYDSGILLVGTHSTIRKHMSTQKYTRLFTAALFIITKKTETTQMSIVKNGYTNWHIHTMD